MRNKLLACLLVLSSSLFAQESIEDYFFSLRQLKYNYTGYPETKASQDINYSMGWSGYVQYIQKTTILQIDGYPYKITETNALEFASKEIRSFKQIYTNFLGANGTFADNIIILTLPEYKNKWTEFNRQARYDCTSQWVYIKYQKQGEENELLYEKAIKVTKSTIVKDGKKTTNIVEYVYWTKEEKLLARYGYWDDHTQAVLQEIAEKVIPTSITEITEKEYNTYIEEKLKKEEEERLARNENIFKEFLKNLEPQPLEKANVEAADRINKYFTKLEIERFKKIVLGGTTNLAEQSDLYITFLPEKKTQIVAPAGEEEIMSAFVNDLYQQKILKTATVTEPVTQRNVEVEEYLNIKHIAIIKTTTYNVVKQKETWRLADKNETMSAEMEYYIKRAAQNAYEADHKKKKQTIDLVSLRYEGAIIEVWQSENGKIISCISSPSLN